MHIVSHRTCGSRPPCTRHPIHACAPVCCDVVVSLHPSPFPLRSVALLPALPDVFLRVPREVEVQTPVRLPLGDRGHFRPRDTPHRNETTTFKNDVFFFPVKVDEEVAKLHRVFHDGGLHLCRVPRLTGACVASGSF